MNQCRTRVPTTLATMLGCFLLCGVARSAPLSPGQFSPTAERINFDQLQAGTDLGHHLAFQGVLIGRGDNGVLRVLTTQGLGGIQPQTLPHALSVPSAASTVPLNLLFASRRNQIGLYFGGVAPGTSCKLRAYGAGGNLLDTVTVTAVAGSATKVATFVGLGLTEALIERATLACGAGGSPKAVDGIVTAPPQSSVSAEPYRTNLLAAGSTRAQKLAAIAALQIRPSPSASQALQTAAGNPADDVVQARAMMALGQIADAGAIPALVSATRASSNRSVARAGRNAVWMLRKLFPMASPPTITVQAIGPIDLNEEFEVEARVTSPVTRDHAEIYLGAAKLLQVIRTSQPRGYKGPLNAGQTVVLHARYRAEAFGTTALHVMVQVVLDGVDQTSWRVPLYVTIDETGGTASMQPPAGWLDEPVQLPIGD